MQSRYSHMKIPSGADQIVDPVGLLLPLGLNLSAEGPPEETDDLRSLQVLLRKIHTSQSLQPMFDSEFLHFAWSAYDTEKYESLMAERRLGGWPGPDTHTIHGVPLVFMAKDGQTGPALWSLLYAAEYHRRFTDRLATESGRVEERMSFLDCLITCSVATTLMDYMATAKPDDPSVAPGRLGLSSISRSCEGRVFRELEYDLNAFIYNPVYGEVTDTGKMHNCLFWRRVGSSGSYAQWNVAWTYLEQNQAWLQSIVQEAEIRRNTAMVAQCMNDFPGVIESTVETFTGRRFWNLRHDHPASHTPFITPE